MIQNAAVLGLIKTSRKDHNSLILAFLLWLPVKSRIEFKILFITYKALGSQGTLYLKSSYYPNTNWISAHTGCTVIAARSHRPVPVLGADKANGGALKLNVRWTDRSKAVLVFWRFMRRTPTPSWWRVRNFWLLPTCASTPTFHWPAFFTYTPRLEQGSCFRSERATEVMCYQSKAKGGVNVCGTVVYQLTQGQTGSVTSWY